MISASAQGLMVDLQTALNLALTLVAFFGGWFLKTIRDDITKLQLSDEKMSQAFNDLRADLPDRYVKRSDMKELADNLFEALRRIEDKIDQKADKLPRKEN